MRFWLISGLAVLLGGGAALAESSYPSPASPWDGAAYVDFYFAHSNGHQALPHLRSPEGQALLARLTDHGNIERILASSAPVGEKRRQLGLIVMSIGAARGAYGMSLAVGEPLAEELARVQAFGLYAIARAAALGSSSPPVSMWTTSLRTAVESVGEDAAFSPEQRAFLVDAIAAELPTLGPLLSRREREQMAAFLGQIGGSSSDQKLRQAIGRLLTAIEEL